MDYTIRTTKKQYADTPLLLRMLGTDHLQEPVNRPSGLPLWQIIYGLSGTGRFRIGGRNHILHEGQAALLTPHTRHSYESTGGKWIVHFIGFSGNSCQKILYDLQFSEPGVYHLGRSVGQNREFLSHVEAFERIINGDMPGKNRLLSKELYAALLDIAEGSAFDRDFAVEKEDETVSDIIYYLEEHFAEDIALADLAEEFRMTPEYLCTRFRQGTGETISSYLKRIRIGHARILLMEKPELPVREAGEMCGFRSSSYFGKVFREMTGTTPQKFRRLI